MIDCQLDCQEKNRWDWHLSTIVCVCVHDEDADKSYKSVGSFVCGGLRKWQHDKSLCLLVAIIFISIVPMQILFVPDLSSSSSLPSPLSF